MKDNSFVEDVVLRFFIEDITEHNPGGILFKNFLFFSLVRV